MHLYNSYIYTQGVAASMVGCKIIVLGYVLLGYVNS